jgi:serine/threonine protein kinase
MRCSRCGKDFRAQGDGEGASRVLSVTPDELDSVPYSQRTIEVPVNSVSSVILGDPALHNDKLLRDIPLKENSKWVGKVRLLKKLGQGGMGTVYQGYDESLALDVAVKILPSPNGPRDAQFVQRFRQEARISAQINHPNVVRTLHVDEQGDMIYLVMDFVAGKTARDLVDEKGPLMVPLALQIIHDVALGMQAAHQHHVVHRDIKPDNILVADDGRVLLSDLGLAKAVSTSGHGQHMPVTRLGLLLGTPDYMSPEQWEIGATVGPAADIWSVGATLWMLLTHKPPYQEKDLAVLARKVREAPLPDIREDRPTLPDNVCEILQKCLAKRPGDRYADAAELLAAIDAALNELMAGKVTITPRPKKATVTSVFASPKPEEAAPAINAPPPIKLSVAPAALPPIPAPQAPNKTRVAALVLVAAVAGVWGLWSLNSQNRSRAPISGFAPALSVDLRCPSIVKPGQDAELVADLSGGLPPGDYAMMWLAGDKVFAGHEVRVPIEQDTEFTFVVRDKNTAREVARRSVTVAVELQARASEKDFYEITTGSPLKLEGRVRGGAGSQKIETRWVDASKPAEVLGNGLSFDVDKLPAFKEPGRYTFQLQAKRKDQTDWSNGASDKVTVQVNKLIPPEFKAAMQLGIDARERAKAAATGADAAASWRVAQSIFEKALQTFDDDDAKAEIALCKQRLELEARYAALMTEARRLREEADAVPATDGVKRLIAWTEAMRPCSSALVLFDRTEVREQAAAIDAKLTVLRNSMEGAEQERAVFEGLIAKARASAKEANKYLSPTVALPHWERALAGFTELGKMFPKRTEEFALELKEVQQNRDKAFLFDNLGVVPVPSVDKPQEMKPAPKVPTPQKAAPQIIQDVPEKK